MATQIQDPDPRVVELFGLVQQEMARTHTTLDSVTDLSDLTRRIVSIIERSEPGSEMAEAVGPFYDTSGLVSWLGYSKQALDKRRRSRKLLGCRTADGKWLYPVWQFQQDGEPLPGLPEVLKVLSAGIDDGWTWALWFVGEVPERLEGMSAREWLSKGLDPSRVLEIARNDAGSWAA
jgi:hypothetical protein